VRVLLIFYSATYVHVSRIKREKKKKKKRKIVCDREKNKKERQDRKKKEKRKKKKRQRASVPSAMGIPETHLLPFFFFRHKRKQTI
jgi:hypothetical protein